jgi:FkbM family methyltransferase
MLAAVRDARRRVPSEVPADPMKRLARGLLDAALRPFRVRVVGARWGPRGCWDALRRVRDQGVVPRQIVDAGASNGCWSRECMRIFPEARYLLVDPLPENRDALEALRASRPNLRVWHGALGSEAGVRELFAHGDQSSFLRSEDFPGSRTPRVEIRTLDSCLDEGLLEPPDLIKADVQGFELELLRGAKRCLERCELLLLEVSFREIYESAPLAHRVIAAAGEAGFRIYDICTYAQRPEDAELMQADILFAADGSSLFRNEGYA